MRWLFSALLLFVAGPSVPAQAVWLRLLPAQSPPARYGHAMAYDPVRDRVVLFGGTTSFAAPPFGDTWEWDGATWQAMAPAQSPAPRHSHGMAFDPVRQHVLLFGGGSLTAFNDTWEWDGTTWTALYPPGAQPPPASYSSCCVPVTMCTHWASRNVVLSTQAQTWEWDGTYWTNRSKPGPSTVPLVYDSGRQSILAYQYNQGTEVWEWTNTWRLIVKSQTPPAPSTPTISLYSPLRSAFVLFGGSPCSAPVDTWEWVAGVWSKVPTTRVPSIRGSGASVTDTRRGLAVLFGGQDSCLSGNLLNDTWQYMTAMTATYTTFGQGCANTTGTPTLAAATGMLPWIGEGFTVQATSLPLTPTPAALWLGLSSTRWAGMALPLDLAAWGAPGCQVLASVDTVFPLANVSGKAFWSAMLPPDTNLLGQSFFQQAAAVDPAANVLGISTSNAGQGVVGVR